MRFRVERDVLTEAVTWVARGLPNRPPTPVLAGILLEADADGSLTLSAFDYEVSARITVEADVHEPGRALVLGRMLSDISKTLPGKPVDVTTDGNKVSVACGSSRFSLLKMPVEEYPTLPVSPEPSGHIPGDVFTHAVAQVSVAADRSDTLPILTGVRMEVDGERMTLLATDRYRLAMRELTWRPDDEDINAVVLVPARTLSDTAKSLGASGSVSVALGEAAGGDGLIGFDAGQRRTTSRLLDGDYPKVSAIFPNSVDTEAIVDTQVLIEAVKRVSIVAERNTPVRLRFVDGQVSIDAGTGEDAQASEAVECQLVGPDIEIAFNPTYLIDGLNAVSSPFTRLAFTQPGKPAVLSGQREADGDCDSSYRYVLMPVRFTN
ncbi:DNA polymerase III subunit beta [Dermatophilus congolensis]|uniref:Beta sliding clamp n=1 Tax=Dermatophilus congolensis TaxID=1863 RepID=A0AA46BQ36_9MICO|nr:DNA polymerase III subunit beta [Dermatophilus congolensis]STD14953.1 DNA polymerase III subunit beta [Dermatophilus congolensis]